MWSIWFWTHYPVSQLSAATIQKRYAADVNTLDTPYCIGFDAGYNWAFDQMRTDEETNKINVNERTK